MLSFCEPQVALDLIDLDKNRLISLAEYNVFRHFWCPPDPYAEPARMLPSDVVLA
jgi:hypothetical protein